MKKTLLTPIVAALVAAFALVAAPQSTEAGGNGSRKQVSTCSSCKKPVYAYSQYAGRRSCGTPIYRWVTQQHTSCSRRSHSSRSSSHSGHGHSSHGSRSNYGSSRGRSSSSSYGSSRGGFSISFGRGGSSCR